MKAAHFGPDVIKGDLYLRPLQTPKGTTKPVPAIRTFPTHNLVQLESKCSLCHFSTFPLFFYPCCSCNLQKQSSWLLLLSRDPSRALSNFIVSHEMMQSNEKLHSALTPIFQSASSTHLWSPAITQNRADLSLWIRNSGSSCKTWKQSIYPGPPARQKETQFHIFPRLFAEQAPS